MTERIEPATIDKVDANGNARLVSPFTFNTSSGDVDPETLPYVPPIQATGKLPQNGSPVELVIRTYDSGVENYYYRLKSEPNAIEKSVVADEQGVENNNVLFANSNMGKTTAMYSNDRDGIVMTAGTDKINTTGNGINITSNNNALQMTESRIYMGNTGGETDTTKLNESFQPAVRYDGIEYILNEIADVLIKCNTELGMTDKATVHTLEPYIQQISNILQSGIIKDMLKSKNLYIN